MNLSQQLSEHGYRVDRTVHFTVCRPPRSNAPVILHTFTGVNVDEDLSPLIAAELGPLGAITSADQFGNTLFAIVATTCPPSLLCARCGRLHLNQPAIWHHFCINSLNRFRQLIADGPSAAPACSHIPQFAAIYQRVIECTAGRTLLDVGTNMGYLPMLVAERGACTRVVGCDIREEAVSCATDVALSCGREDVTFTIQDVRNSDFAEMGVFDTVTAVHLLEHFTESETPAVLSNLLTVAGSRLIVAVPYEETLEPLYGHQQVFTTDILRRWGEWCVSRLGHGQYRCEDVSGGLLIVDRDTTTVHSTRPAASDAGR
jgi:SAM-dependent methyltransferase